MQPRSLHLRRQRGVVLIVALVMLVVISLLAALSVRNATSSEAVSGNVRTTELATQAAEMALRFCEDQVVNYVSTTPGLTSATYDITVGGGTLKVVAAGIVDPMHPVNTWDGNPQNVTYALPLDEINDATKPAYSRPPECLAEHLPVVNSTKTAMDYTSTYRITARGFGPEVATDASRGRPTGSEVWLQSTITVNTP